MLGDGYNHWQRKAIYDRINRVRQEPSVKLDSYRAPKVSKDSVYLIKCGDFNIYKIGYTGGEATQRMNALQTSNPFRLSLIGSIHGNREYEKKLHKVAYEYGAKHLTGEWFEMSEEIVAKILVYFEIKGVKYEV